MELRLSERVLDCQASIQSATEELTDYQTLGMLIRSIQTVTKHPERYQYSEEDYTKVVDKIDRLCQKHELRIPPSTNWTSVEII